MADMTRKHHALIADAVTHAACKAVESIPSSESDWLVYRTIRSILVEEFAKRLRFTNDKFDPKEFGNLIPHKLDDAKKEVG